MNFFGLKGRLKGRLIAVFAIAGILVSFVGVEAGSPIRLLRTESTELLFSCKDRQIRVFKFARNQTRRLLFFTKSENYKQALFRELQSVKINLRLFAEKKIIPGLLIKKLLFLRVSLGSDEFFFASFRK